MVGSGLFGCGAQTGWLNQVCLTGPRVFLWIVSVTISLTTSSILLWVDMLVKAVNYGKFNEHELVGSVRKLGGRA